MTVPAPPETVMAVAAVSRPVDRLVRANPACATIPKNDAERVPALSTTTLADPARMAYWPLILPARLLVIVELAAASTRTPVVVAAIVPALVSVVAEFTPYSPTEPVMRPPAWLVTVPPDSRCSPM